MTFDEVGRRIINLYGEERYDEALEVIDAAYADHPGEDRTLTFWRACLLGVTGRPEEAFGALFEGMTRGLWWAPDTLADADLDPVRALPGWEGLLERCRETTERFVADHRPSPQVRLAAAESAAGTLVTMHGAGVEPRGYADRWRAATPETWTVVAPIGSVPFTDTEWAWPAAYTVGGGVALDQLAAIGFPSPVVLAGFSQGSALAALLAWEGRVEAAGLLLVAPSVRRPAWDPVTHRRVPTYIAIGEHDWALPGIRQLVGLLEAHEVPVHLEVLPGIGHQTPDDLDAVVAAALGWIAS